MSAPGRIRYLDGIRAVAILMVLQQHWLKTPTLLTGGYLGVDLFFVLSGFIITGLLMRSSAGYSRFLARRVRRLYPALIAAVAGGVLLCMLPFSAVPVERAVRSAGAALTQTSSFILGTGVGSVDPFGVTWSLGAEWCFYLLWPLAVLAWRRSGTAPERCAHVSLVVAMVCFVSALPFGVGWIYYGPVARFAELLVGSALAYMVRAAGDEPRPWPAWTGWAALFGLGAWSMVGPTYLTMWFPLVGMPLAAIAAVTLIMLGHIRPDTLLSRLLGSWPLAGLGLVSYSLYLWHTIPSSLLTRASTPWLSDHQRLAVIVVSTAVLTAASYWLVERPSARGRVRTPSAPVPARTSAKTWAS